MSRSSSQQRIQVWDPAQTLERVSPAQVKLSAGFLRAQPQVWLPGFDGEWRTLFDALGWQVQMREVRPMADVAQLPGDRFFALFDEHLLCVVIDRLSAKALGDQLLPRSPDIAQRVGVDYLVRRFLSTVAQSWSGGGGSLNVKYASELTALDSSFEGAIKFTVLINGQSVSASILLSPPLVERIDGMWRRQLRSGSRTDLSGSNWQIEVAQLAIAPLELPKYLAPNAMIDLQRPASSEVQLRDNQGRVIRATLLNSGQHFALALAGQPLRSPELDPSMTRLSIVFGELPISQGMIPELSQPGTLTPTTVPISDRVNLLLNGDVVGRATLGMFEGRFALTVNTVG